MNIDSIEYSRQLYKFPSFCIICSPSPFRIDPLRTLMRLSKESRDTSDVMPIQLPVFPLPTGYRKTNFMRLRTWPLMSLRQASFPRYEWEVNPHHQSSYPSHKFWRSAPGEEKASEREVIERFDGQFRLTSHIVTIALFYGDNDTFAKC